MVIIHSPVSVGLEQVLTTPLTSAMEQIDLNFSNLVKQLYRVPDDKMIRAVLKAKLSDCNVPMTLVRQLLSRVDLTSVDSMSIDGITQEDGSLLFSGEHSKYLERSRTVIADLIGRPIPEQYAEIIVVQELLDLLEGNQREEITLSAS